MVNASVDFFEEQKKFLAQSNVKNEDKNKLFLLYDECIKLVKEIKYEELQTVCDQINLVLNKVIRDQEMRKTDNTWIVILIFLVIIIIIM